MTVEELYDLCGNWLPTTTVSVFSVNLLALLKYLLIIVK